MQCLTAEQGGRNTGGFFSNIITGFVLGFIEASVIPSSREIVLPSLYALVILIPGIAVTVRRLHDTGRSGWWLLILLVPFIGPVVFLIFMLQDGQPGENRYGPNPKALGGTHACYTGGQPT